MNYLAFWNLDRAPVGFPAHVPSHGPVPIDIADVYSRIFAACRNEGNFFGMVDPAGTTLQFYSLENADRFSAEVPRPDLGGSYNRLMTFDQVAELLKSLPVQFPLRGFSGFRFEPWTS